MTDQYSFSDEMLNAYIDGELGDDDARRLLEQLPDDHDLSERLAHLREVSDMLKMSYAGIRPPGKCEFMLSRWTKSHSLVAGVLLFVGVAIGWFIHQPGQQPGLFASYSQHQPDDGVWRIVIQVSTADPYMQQALLDETESILDTFRKNGKKLEVEIVASGGGLSMLMTDRTEYADRIESLESHYKNVTFTACKRSMKHIAELQGDEVTLLPGTHVAPSGLSRVLMRQQEGWHYIRL